MKYTLKNKEIELTDKEVEEIVAKYTKKDKRWKPQGGNYWFVDSIGVLHNDTWSGSASHLDRLNAIATVTDYIYENEMLWTEGKQLVKYYLVYDKRRDELFTDWVGNHTHLMIEIPYLKSEEACEQLIKVLPEELKLIFK